MNKAELESKHLSDLHALAAEAGVERFRMLTRAELIEKLSDGDGGGARTEKAAGGGERPRRERPRDRDRDRDRERRRERRAEKPEPEEAEAEEAEPEREPERRAKPEPRAAQEPKPAAAAPAEPAKPRRRRRRRRFGRRKDTVTIQGLLLPPEPGRQAILYGETREACTALLRGVAADLADSKGPDPVALLIDPSPEELADWKREAPQAEIVSAGQPRHADDALAQAAARANAGEHVLLLVDSLTRLATAYGDADAAKDFYDAGRTQVTAATGTLTIVAALEKPSS
jgi:hypothetical protein